MVEVATSSSLCKMDKTTPATSSKSSASAYALVPLFSFFFLFKGFGNQYSANFCLVARKQTGFEAFKRICEAVWLRFFPIVNSEATQARADCFFSTHRVSHGLTIRPYRLRTLVVSLWFLIVNDWLKQYEDKLNHNISTASLGLYKPSITHPLISA